MAIKNETAYDYGYSYGQSLAKRELLRTLHLIRINGYMPNIPDSDYTAMMGESIQAHTQSYWRGYNDAIKRLNPAAVYRGDCLCDEHMQDT